MPYHWSRKRHRAATAELLARAGADLILVDVDKGTLVEIAELSRQLGAEVATATLDVRESSPINELMEQQSSDGKRIDVLVRNAGVAHPLRLEEITDEEWEKVMNINLKRAVASSLRQRTRPRRRDSSG